MNGRYEGKLLVIHLLPKCNIKVNKMVKNLMQLQNLRWYFAPFVKLYPQFMIDDLKIKINLSILISNLNQPHTHDLDWFKYLQEPPTFFHIRYEWSIIQSSVWAANFCLQKISCSLRPITIKWVLLGLNGYIWKKLSNW